MILCSGCFPVKPLGAAARRYGLRRPNKNTAEAWHDSGFRQAPVRHRLGNGAGDTICKTLSRQPGKTALSRHGCV